jgi:hypothetical protein
VVTTRLGDGNGMTSGRQCNRLGYGIKTDRVEYFLNYVEKFKARMRKVAVKKPKISFI